MERNAWTLAVSTALSFGCAFAAVGLSAQQVGAEPLPGLQAQHVPEWWYVKEAPLAEVQVDRARVYALMDVKLELRTQMRVADEQFEASRDKATEETRRALVVAGNKAWATLLLSEETAEVTAAQDVLGPAIQLVADEVAAWEAEEARKAEEARLAEEARKAAAAASSSRSTKSSGASSSGSGQTPQQYLNAIATKFGTSISWSDSVCGRSGSGGWVGGCYTGGSSVVVSNSAWASWETAKGAGRNVVLHEVGHYLTKQLCGTIYVGGERFENVNDARTILLGASATTGYGYNADDMALAQALAAGRCEV